MKTYPSSLTDSQWSAILGILDDKRKRKHSLREIFNALFYLLKTGCQWRMLPFHFPSWKLVYYYFNVSSEIYLVNFSKIYLRFIGVKLIGYQASDYMDKSILWFSVSGMF
jgi:transposase